jgi:hypothetical protein
VSSLEKERRACMFSWAASADMVPPPSGLANQRVFMPATYPAHATSFMIRTFCGFVTTALKWPV